MRGRISLSMNCRTAPRTISCSSVHWYMASSLVPAGEPAVDGARLPNDLTARSSRGFARAWHDGAMGAKRNRKQLGAAWAADELVLLRRSIWKADVLEGFVVDLDEDWVVLHIVYDVG